MAPSAISSDMARRAVGGGSSAGSAPAARQQRAGRVSAERARVRVTLVDRHRVPVDPRCGDRVGVPAQALARHAVRGGVAAIATQEAGAIVLAEPERRDREAPVPEVE
jgi:hypothetical protein